MYILIGSNLYVVVMDVADTKMTTSIDFCSISWLYESILYARLRPSTNRTKTNNVKTNNLEGLSEEINQGSASIKVYYRMSYS